jgi:Tfp pilus assembly protein PilF
MILRDNLLKILAKKGGTPAAPDLASQIATQMRAWVYYIREWLWPTSLSIDKRFDVSRTLADPKVMLAILVILCILAAAFFIRKRHPVITFGILWFFTALLPTTLIRLNVVINDHRLYLPGLGLVLVITYTAAHLFQRFRIDGGIYYRTFITICVLTMLFMGLGTFKRNAAFATEETMWKDVILKDRRSVRGYNNLGIYYEQNNQYEKALAHYRQTIRLSPAFPNPYINIGNVYHKMKKYEEAERWMKRAIELDPKSALATYNLGNILREAGKTREAIETYQRALQLNPRYIEAANNLANIYFKLRNYQEAIRYYERALFIDPTFAMSYYNIALANENQGQFEEAKSNYEKFLRFWLGDPKYIAHAKRKLNELGKRIAE